MKLRVLDAGNGLWALLLHGFTRNGGHLEPLAQALLMAGIGSVRPDLGSFNWFRSVNNGGYLATGLHTVQGIVFVDANESPTHLMKRAWPKLSTVPMVAICAPASRCNRHGAFARWARAHDVAGCVVEAMGHGDIEGNERAMYRIVCGDVSTGSTRTLVQELVIASTRRFLNLPETSDPWQTPAVHSW